ncbi:MAG TPA: hypothetical protein VE360_05015, partial [Pyrinomonadaceae bacterium]|nr:hypothetical protein [Pyrinomonadaceae bacterium]
PHPPRIQLNKHSSCRAKVVLTRGRLHAAPRPAFDGSAATPAVLQRNRYTHKKTMQAKSLMNITPPREPLVPRGVKTGRQVNASKFLR